MTEHCPHCQALRAEVAELRRDLGLSREMTHQRAIERGLGLQRQQARLVLALYLAAPRVVPRERLEYAVMGPDALLKDPSTLKTIVSRVRAILGQDTIETAQGRGYQLTPAGHALVHKVVV